MKTIRILLTLVLTLACFTAQAQATKTSTAADSTVNITLVDKQPTYPGGEVAMLSFIAQNLVYPAKAIKQKKQGIVLLKFVVGTDGAISNIKVDRSLSPECDKAAIDVVKKLQRFVPAQKDGHPVAVWLTLPLRFRIQ